jgi:4-hydroxy-2-oxoheptanedioate aldolase
MAARLKQLLAGNQLLRVCLLGQLCSPKIVEIVAWTGGFDAVWFDQEHAALTIPQIEDAARAARSCDLPCFVRAYASDYSQVMRPLEAGAGGVMAAMVQTAAEAEEIVRWTKFHPRGYRGINGTGVDNQYGVYGGSAYFQRANAETFLAIQIERRQALEEVEAIAAIADIDLLFIGPADLSQALGLPGQWDHPTIWAAVERVARAAAEHGKPWGILPLNPEHARRCVALGCRMLSIGADTWFLQRGIKAFQGDFGEFFGPGAPR